MLPQVKKSFLKWAGGKSRLLPHILPEIQDGRRLIEPFMGSAVVLLNAPQQEIVAADLNQDLIGLMASLMEVKNFIQEARKLFTEENNTEENYLRLRDTFNRSRKREERARIFLYLNRHGFNGLCRYNLKGQFNVPFGRYANPGFPEAALLETRKILRSKHVILAHQGFEKTFDMAGSGDTVYADPPYADLPGKNSFKQYSGTQFGWSAQERLVEKTLEAQARGAKVVISNHDTPEIRNLYSSASVVKSLMARRSISADGQKRGEAGEIIAVWLPGKP